MKELLEEIKKCAQQLQSLESRLKDGDSVQEAFQLIRKAEDLKKRIDEYTG